MQPKGWMMLHALINRYHQGSKESLLSCLPDDEADTFLSYDVQSNDVSLAARSCYDTILRTHYSWLAPATQQLPLALQSLVVAALPEHQATGVRRLLSEVPEEAILPDPLKGFFLGILYDYYKGEELPTPPLMSPTPLNGLMDLNKHRLVEVIDLLGLYDLAEEMRHVVDKEKLKRILHCLSQKRQQYLKICLHQRDKLAPPPLGLECWDGDRKKLENLLHRRGLMRFAKALSGYPEQLVEHLVHVLDTGRGNMIKKYYSQEAIPGVGKSLVRQITGAVKFLNKSE